MRSQLTRYLIVPGWQGSDSNHWQSHWQRTLPNAQRVEQKDWLKPDLDDWVKALGAEIASAPTPVILIAHSLGCITVAHWARTAHARHLRQVRGALLVAPADVERDNCPEALRGFAPIPQSALPFPSHVIGSDNDKAATALRASKLASDWGSEISILLDAGHINPAAGFTHWEGGFAWLYRLQSQIEQRSRRLA